MLSHLKISNMIMRGEGEGVKGRLYIVAIPQVMSVGGDTDKDSCQCSRKPFLFLSYPTNLVLMS